MNPLEALRDSTGWPLVERTAVEVLRDIEITTNIIAFLLCALIVVVIFHSILGD